MQIKRNRIVDLVLGTPTATKLGSFNILLVGAGGIGCQVVKNLSRIPLQHLTVLDYDSIEETNLNRQFYFRKDHIGQPKPTIIQKSVQEYAPDMPVTAICDNLYNKRFTDRFYKQFDIIISALDSIKAREHLAAQATRNNIPLIDAGTMSYFGQAYASIRFLTACHNCQPSKSHQDNGAACLIRSKPERPIHCGLYAKNFYDSFFGNNGQTLSDRLNPQKLLSNAQGVQDEVNLKGIAESIFNELFEIGVNDQDSQGNKRNSIRKLKMEYALNSLEIVQNPKTTLNPIQLQKQKNTSYEEQKLWSLQKYTVQFLNSCVKLLKRKFQGSLPCNFEKDDEDCMLLAHCITNLRTYNYISESLDNKLSYLTYYQSKDLIGNVMPAISSSNAIAAALEIRELINIASGRTDRLRVIHFTNQGEERLSPCFQSSSSMSCQLCPENVIYAKVRLNMRSITFGEFQLFASRELFSFGRDLYSGPFVIIRNSKKSSSCNKNKPISFVNQMIVDGILPVSFRPILNRTPITVHISIFHNQQTQSIEIFETPSKSELKLQLLKYFRRAYQNDTIIKASELSFIEDQSC